MVPQLTLLRLVVGALVFHDRYLIAGTFTSLICCYTLIHSLLSLTDIRQDSPKITISPVFFVLLIFISHKFRRNTWMEHNPPGCCIAHAYTYLRQKLSLPFTYSYSVVLSNNNDLTLDTHTDTATPFAYNTVAFVADF